MNKTAQSGTVQATQLVRAGQLVEATALIQRTLRSLAPPDSETDTAEAPMEILIQGRAPIIDAGVSTPTGPPQAHRDRAPWQPPRFDLPLPTPRQAPLQSLPPTILGRSRQRTPDRRVEEEQSGGQFLTGSYTNQVGTRSYKLYVPASYHGQALPLLVMLHGCTQDPDDFAAGTRMNIRADEYGCFVVYPAQAPAANQSKCWNWFRAADQHRGHGEPSLIAGLTEQIVRNYAIDPRRVYVAGLSAGGAMADIMGTLYPDIYAAVGIHSGLPYAAARDLPSAFAAMRQGGVPAGQHGADRIRLTEPFMPVVPTIVFHGDRDTTVHPNNGEDVIARWKVNYVSREEHRGGVTNLQMAVRRGQVPDGHAYTCTTYHAANGCNLLEHWEVHGAGHAWSGGSAAGSFTDPHGPDATREMIRFFQDRLPCTTDGSSGNGDGPLVADEDVTA